MRIAIFTDTFPPQVNGVSHVAYHSARALAERGNDVVVFAVSRTKNHGGTHNISKLKIITIPSVPFWGYPGERFTVPLGIAVRKACKFNPDVIHVHTPFSVGLEAVWASRALDVPLIGTHHTFYDHYLKHVKLDFPWIKKPSWKLMVMFYNKCNSVLSPTRSLGDVLSLHGLRTPVEIVPNPIDTTLFRPVADVATKNKLKARFGVRGPSVVYMGRVSYEKSIEQVVDAAAYAVKNIPDLTLMVVGDGPDKVRLEEYARKRNVERNVVFLGFRHGKELVEALQANEIFVTASKSENMPLSILEGMATGLPVIAADALGIPEIVKDNENGFLVPPDQPKEMAKKIVELLQDKKLMKKFGSVSRKRSLAYSHDHIAELLEKVYRSAIDNHK